MSFDLFLIPKFLSLKDAVANHLATGVTFKTIADTIKDANVLGALEELGERMFPKVAPELRAAAAIAASFDTNGVKWVQGALNRLVTPSPNLDVDGHTGPLTIAAVEAFQRQVGSVLGIDIKPDGWAGDKTMAAIQWALLKLEQSAQLTI